MTKTEALKQAIQQLNEISEWLNEGLVEQLGEQADWHHWVGHDALPSAATLGTTQPTQITLLQNSWKAREAANNCIDWVDNHLPPEEMQEIFNEL